MKTVPKIKIYLNEIPCIASDICTLLGLLLAQSLLVTVVASAQEADISVLPVPDGLHDGRVWESTRFPKGTSLNPFLPYKTAGVPIGTTAAKMGVCDDMLIFHAGGFVDMVEHFGYMTAYRFADLELQQFLLEYLRIKGVSEDATSSAVDSLDMQKAALILNALSVMRGDQYEVPDLIPVHGTMSSRRASKILERGATLCMARSDEYQYFIRAEGRILVAYVPYESSAGKVPYLMATKAAYNRYDTLRYRLYPELSQGCDAYYEVPEDLILAMPVENGKSYVDVRAKIFASEDKSAVLDIPEA